MEALGRWRCWDVPRPRGSNLKSPGTAEGSLTRSIIAGLVNILTRVSAVATSSNKSDRDLTFQNFHQPATISIKLTHRRI